MIEHKMNRSDANGIFACSLFEYMILFQFWYHVLDEPDKGPWTKDHRVVSLAVGRMMIKAIYILAHLVA